MRGDRLRGAGVWATWLGGLLLGCASRGPTSEPVPAAPVVVADSAVPSSPVGAVASTHRLSFVVALESSCSQSWEHTTHTGDLVVTIDGRGQAVVDLSVQSRSVGPGNGGQFHVTEDHAACRWSGVASEDDGALVLAVSARAEDPRESYVCGIAGEPARSKHDAFQLRCLPVPRGESPERTLACTPVTPAPWLMELLRTRDGIPLGGPDLALEVTRGDLIEGEPILRSAPRL